MSKINKPNKYIVFNIPPSEKYETNTKYQLTDEDANYYYLSEYKLDKNQEDIDYTIGETIRPRT